MKYKILSGNVLKIIAALAMVFDHIAVLFFRADTPSFLLLKSIGRISFPIFAFMIAESARYTRSKKRHFLMLFGLAAICQAVYFIADNKSLYMCILVTFSISTLLIYALKKFKHVFFSKNADTFDKFIWGFVFLSALLAAYIVTEVMGSLEISAGGAPYAVDYGFIGCITPVFASFFDFRDLDVPERCRRLDTVTARTLCLIPAMAALIIRYAITHEGSFNIQVFSLLALPLLLLYSGERGTPKLKYFFYIFYPLHLVLLYGIAILIKFL